MVIVVVCCRDVCFLLFLSVSDSEGAIDENLISDSKDEGKVPWKLV